VHFAGMHRPVETSSNARAPGNAFETPRISINGAAFGFMSEGLYQKEEIDRARPLDGKSNIPLLSQEGWREAPGWFPKPPEFV